jgi:hypothetical protein
MYMVQLFLPLYDNDNKKFIVKRYEAVRKKLTDRFGGLTCYGRAPVEGLWKDDKDDAKRDDLVIYEVITEELDVAWWQTYRRQLERTFRQEQILVRAHQVQIL